MKDKLYSENEQKIGPFKMHVCSSKRKKPVYNGFPRLYASLLPKFLTMSIYSVREKL